MKFLFASDSFKGTLTSEQIIALLTGAAKKVFPDCETVGIPVADGGEGTIDAVISVLHGSVHEVNAHGPLMEEVVSYYGESGDGAAVIEMAVSSGLPMVPVNKRDPRVTTSYGNGEELSGCGNDLARVADIDIRGLHGAVKDAKFTIMCDVNNPLTGPDGATYTFGKQKGGSPEILDELEQGMIHYAALIREKMGTDVDQIPGSGAAGGLGAAFCVFLKAEMKSGIETVLDLIHFDELLEGVDLVITGEGRIDWQSAFGKVPSGIGNRCRKKGIPAIAIVGGMGDKAEMIFDHGIDSIITTINGAMGLDEALERAEELYAGAAERAFRMVKAGMNISVR